MTCLPFSDPELMERFMRGELPEAEEQAIEDHVLDCDDCAAQLADLATLGVELARRREEIENKP